MSKPSEMQWSIEIAKAGFDNAQERISAIDTKVSLALGLLGLLLPVPFVVAAWLCGLEGDSATVVLGTCSRQVFLSTFLVISMVIGMACALWAIRRGIGCVSPRGPKGYCGTDPWSPNVLFPLYEPARSKAFCEHSGKLSAGVDLKFVIEEYEHQLVQLGDILHQKFDCMGACFKYLQYCLVAYGAAVAFSVILGVLAVISATQSAVP